METFIKKPHILLVDLHVTQSEAGFKFRSLIFASWCSSAFLTVKPFFISSRSRYFAAARKMQVSFDFMKSVNTFMWPWRTCMKWKYCDKTAPAGAPLYIMYFLRWSVLVIQMITNYMYLSIWNHKWTGTCSYMFVHVRVCAFCHSGTFSSTNLVGTSCPQEDESPVLMSNNIISEVLVKVRPKVRIEVRLSLGLGCTQWMEVSAMS